ncbi:hypothetical protein, partial [Erythrobacter sp. CCH5-A1]
IGSPGARWRGVPEGTSLTHWRTPSLGSSHQAQEVHMGMQLELFKALKSVKIASTDAEKVVEELEGHIAMKVTEANAPLIAELRATREAISREVERTKWYFSTAIVIAGLVIAITNALN